MKIFFYSAQTTFVFAKHLCLERFCLLQSQRQTLTRWQSIITTVSLCCARILFCCLR